jgi:hypothetical protein
MILSMEGSIRRISCRLLASRTGTGTGRVSADKGTWVHVYGGGEVGLESFCGKHKTGPAEWAGVSEYYCRYLCGASAIL